MITDVRIRAFRATDDEESCQKFLEGHKRVLENHGIKKVTSANTAWAKNSSVFVIAVESLDGEKMYGGGRVHAVDGKYYLPIELAVGSMEPRIFDIVKHYSMQGTGELCGLWNSWEVAGFGIGSLYTSIAAISLTNQLGITSLFSLTSPATVEFSQRIGGRIMTNIGNGGTFYYPKINFIATAILLKDATTLITAGTVEREKMLALRKTPVQKILESFSLGKRSINIHYNLIVNRTNPEEFKLINKKNKVHGKR